MSTTALPMTVATPAVPELEIVRAATLAPSPDNNQPWRFRFHDQTLFVEHDPTRALPSDVDRMFDLLGLGAAIENACVAARHFGWLPSVTYLATEHGPRTTDNLVAKIDFRPGGSPDPLWPFLTERQTCRAGFSRRPLADELLRELAAEARLVVPGAQVDWITDRGDVRRLAALVAAGDRVRLEYRAFHTELYRQLRFSPAEVERTRDGLDLRLLALPPGGSLILRMLRSWNVMTFFNRCGFSRLLTASSALAVWQSGAVGILSVSANEADEYLNAGRAFERLWLTATRHRIALHPLGSLPILLRRLTGGAGVSPAGGNAGGTPTPQAGETPLLAAHRRLGERVRRALGEMSPAIAGRTVTMLFRIGHAPPAPGRSLRRCPEEVLEPEHSAEQA